jgi:S-adenosylmethionine:tRNA ribosyltransferase-isomerase
MAYPDRSPSKRFSPSDKTAGQPVGSGIEDFEYPLPPERIAQDPAEPRDSSRLLVLDRANGGLRHAVFREIGSFLAPGDLLVFNDTRVLPARLYAAKKGTGGRVEILLLRRREPQVWEALVGGKRVRPGTILLLEDDGRTEPTLAKTAAALSAEVLADLGESRRLIRFSAPVSPRLAALGQMPLPPYIHKRLANPERYQTVYARDAGSAAAPTAGLHFTPGLIDGLRRQGIETAFVTLHVGLDTFAPITEARVEDHVIHAEWVSVPEEAASAVNRARAESRRVIAVGTTSVRSLETAAQSAGPAGGGIVAYEGDTRLYITPGYRFRAVDAMVTNFHLPKSSLLVMVSAFAGRERILRAYAEAIRLEYRFYSFGDAMLIH